MNHVKNIPGSGIDCMWKGARDIPEMLAMATVAYEFREENKVFCMYG